MQNFSSGPVIPNPFLEKENEEQSITRKGKIKGNVKRLQKTPIKDVSNEENKKLKPFILN
jgi:hypothetical protein